jgi:hypothetical protein
MRTAVSVLLLLIAPSVPGWSQMGLAQEDADRITNGIDWIGAHAASGYVVSMGCSNGDPGSWKRVVDALDLRYQRCAKIGSPLEQVVARHFAREWQYAQAAGLSTAAGTLSFERWLPMRARQFEAASASERCSSLWARTLLEPGSVPQAELEASNLHPKAKGDIEMISAICQLVDDRKWLEAPCDEFFPKK